MGKYFEILLERYQKRNKVLAEIDDYLLKIKYLFRRFLKDKKARIILFGSYLSGVFGPNSDIDILIISEKTPKTLEGRSKIISQVKRRLDYSSIFEFHLISEDEYENWYKNFIKNNYKEI